MKRPIYEEHNITKKELPFIFHTDSVNSTNGIPNWHTNLEFLCCIEGSGTVKCGNVTQSFSVGDIAVINSDVFHVVCSNTSVRYHCLIIDLDFFQNNSLNIDQLYFQEKITDAALYNNFLSIAALFQPSNDPYRSAVIKHAILGFLILLCQRYSFPKTEEAQDSVNGRRMKQVINYIRKHIDEDLTLDDIAASVGCSKYYLSREFKKYTNHTIFEEINLFRCIEAGRLIHDGMTVSAAARSCGFENLSYFSRTYKKYMGKLPSAQT